MTDNNVLTIMMSDSKLLNTIIEDYRDKVQVSARMYKGKVRVAVDFAPEILAEVLRDETD